MSGRGSRERVSKLHCKTSIGLSAIAFIATRWALCQVVKALCFIFISTLHLAGQCMSRFVWTEAIINGQLVTPYSFMNLHFLPLSAAAAAATCF